MTALTDEARALFDGPNFGHLATTRPDGSPHSIPLWIAVHDDRIAFLASPHSHKARNIARNPQVAISITAKDNPYQAGYVRGRVTDVVDGDAGWAIVDEIAKKYTGQPYPREEYRVAFLVEPEHVWTQAFV